MKDILAIILAAGKGTRMKSELPKVLHSVAGKPMLAHITERAFDLDSEVICVIGYEADKVRKRFNNSQIRFVRQNEQLGTGHAVLQAKKYIKKHNGHVLILCGDTPLIKKKSLQKLIKYHKVNNAGLSILTTELDDPQGYGRIIRNNSGHIEKIVEETDASPAEKEIKEINAGVYCFESNLLAQSLDQIDCDNAQGEYYLTDAVDLIQNKGEKVLPVLIENSKEIIGVNTRKDLAQAEKIYRNRINDRHLENGVTIIDPRTTYIDAEVQIEADTTIYPFTFIQGKCKIGNMVTVGPYNRLINTEIGDNVELKANCIIRESKVNDNCTIGPFAYIRPESELKEGVKVGDFVELKKASVGENTKIPHLSYVGDARIGRGTNVGAGTVFANYDGKNKHQTRVGDSSFIGSNTTLVAPVTVEDGGKTGAGAVVIRDIPANTTVIGVPARVYNKDK